MYKIHSKRLGDVVNFKRGYDLPSYARRPGKFPIISSGGLSGYHDDFKADGEGIITGRYGTLGEMYYVNGKYWPHNTALYVQNFFGNYPKYVYYLLKCLGNLKTSDKSTVPGINRNDLHEVQVPFIEKEFQKPIADFLSVIDAKIDLNNRINSELEGMAKLIYDYWFVQFDFPISEAQAAAMGRPELKGKPYKSSGGKMVFNRVLKRIVPEGWEVESLLSVADFANGIACQKYRPKKGEDSLPVIKIKEMRDGVTGKTERVSFKIPDKCFVEDGDILFSWSASLEVMIWAGGNGGLNQHIFKVTSEIYPNSYVYFVLMDYLVQFKRIAELRKTTMGHITQDHLKQSIICIPPASLVSSINEILEPIFSRSLKAKKESKSLAELRDWLLPMLMNGQVRVMGEEGEVRMAAEPGGRIFKELREMLKLKRCSTD